MYSENEKILLAIKKRAKQVFEIEGEKYVEESSLTGLLNYLTRFGAQGRFKLWVIITGVYPTKFEFQAFESSILVEGGSSAIEHLIRERLKEVLTATLMLEINLVSSQANFFDITHTSEAPYITGIQRVVREIYRSGETYNIQGIRFNNDLRTFQRASFTSPNESDYQFWEKNQQIRELRFMLKNYHFLNRFSFGRFLIRILEQSAKKRRDHLVLQKSLSLIKQHNSNFKENLYIVGKRLTIPEIPASLDHIYVYEGLINVELINLQIILYDFIPFFHAWTVHPGNRGHLNSYIRIVLLANRVICISKLVFEQATLILQAFSLERSEWRNRTLNISYKGLPAGIEPLQNNEFIKDPQLVVMAGSIEPRKNNLLFFDALELLNQRGIYIKARLLGGSGWSNDYILERLTKLQNRGVDISLVNPTDSEMREWIGKAQILLQLSEAEGFGLPVAEALALGTKVIVSNIRPLNEWNNSRVEITSLGQPEELAQKIIVALNNPEKNGIAILADETWDSWADMLFK